MLLLFLALPTNVRLHVCVLTYAIASINPRIVQTVPCAIVLMLQSLRYVHTIHIQSLIPQLQAFTVKLHNISAASN